MSTGTYPITGIQDGVEPNGARPLRYEINKFANPQYNPYAKDQLNLFLLALEKVQAMPRTERLSWFQIGGIHGEPYVDWDNSKGTVQPGDKQWLGYCTHASILFPTWHRLYLTLVEQAVHECMKKVVSEFPPEEQVRLKPAVDNWRYPYWDWALATQESGSKRLVVPELMRAKTAPVQRPLGHIETIANPMYSYGFPLNAQGQTDGISDVMDQGRVQVPFSRAPYTVRHPLMYDDEKPFDVQVTWSQGISDNNAVEHALNNGIGTRPGGRQLVAQVYDLFPMRSYPPFSNTRWNGSGQVEDYKSLESVHNNVHVFIGGMTYGHMSMNEVAAFDPAFWMHHGNIERLLTIFQALNPQDYKDWPDDEWLKKTVEPWFTGVSQADADGTWTRPHGKDESTNSPLTPFHKDVKGSVYDSDGCRYANHFGYAFEELQDWLPKYHTSGRFNAPLFCQDIRRSLIGKYGWALPQLGSIWNIVHHSPIPPESDPRSLPLKERQYKEYVISARVDRFANHGQTFVVNFFLGDVPSEVSSWEDAEKLGIISFFGGNQFEHGQCSNCASQAEHEDTRLVTGQISITTALVDVIESKTEISRERLQTLDKDEVGKFLKEHLHWRVSTLGNHELDIHNIPSLRVSVAVATATIPVEDDEFVRYSEFEVLKVATSGRLSGFDPTEDTF